MLLLDFINVGNGDAILIRETAGEETRFSMLVDFGHDRLVRDDHVQPLDPRSQRIYAGDFLRESGVTRLDAALLTHFHRDHVGGLSRVLDAATVGTFYTTYLPPANAAPLEPDADPDFPKAARNFLRNMEFYRAALHGHPDRIDRFVVFSGHRTETLQLTPDLRADVLFGEPALYPRQRVVCDAAFAGERNDYDLIHWAKALNVSSLRLRLYYRGREIVLGGDVYAHAWETVSLTPCDVLKVPHHASLASTTRKFLEKLRPRVAVVCAAANRPDERPHPYTVALLREYVKELYFTDAVAIEGLVEPQFHKAVHLEIE
ncbi:MAG: MBL fold metallo-hydrolase [Oscillibacter sp.]|nr:MBL fold metallo-hydrolase [Oscillibacter sp.]